MKKTVSILSLSMFLAVSAYAGEKIVVANAASSQPRAIMVKAKSPAKQKAVSKQVAHDYALESFSCCGLPQ